MTLLEYMISVSGMVILMVLFVQGVTQLYMWRRALLSTFYSVSSEWVAGAKIARDIRHGPQIRRQWELSADRVSWQGDRKHTWYCTGNKLLFREGQGVVSVDTHVRAISGITDCTGGLIRGIHLQMHGAGSNRNFVMYIPLYAKLFSCS